MLLQLQFSLIGILLMSLMLEVVVCSPEVRSHRQDALPLQNATYTTDDNICAELPDGAYPDYSQACRMFFICSGGMKAATFWCTKGFVFSFTSGHCEPPDRARCPDPNNPSFLNNVFHLHQNGVSNDCNLGDGVFPNFSDGCYSFYICKGGIKSNFKCPNSLKFDWRTRSCRKPYNVICDALSCDDKEDGTYIDSNSYCRRYFQCNSGNISEFVCPDGTIYNARQHRCTRSSTTRCHGLESAQCAGLPDGYYPDFAADCKIFGLCMSGGLKTFNCPANTFFHIKTLTCENDGYCPKPEINKCIGKTNGIHPDFESECRNFFMCLDGLLTHQGSCPQGKILNPRNGDCQPTSLATCTEVIDADCDGLSDGVYPDHDTGCSAFFICLSEKRISTSYCTGTDLFDMASGRCLPSSFVLCRSQLSAPSPPRLFDSYNCDNRLGIFPEFSSDCQKYATCAYGHKQYFQCPNGFSFDTESNTCKRGTGHCRAPFAVATFQCLPGYDGVYVGLNCSQWHECRNGIGFTNVCPKGLFYHANAGKCIKGSKICPSNYVIQKRLFRAMDVLPFTSRDASSCPSRTIGLFEDPASCKNFHFCVDGTPISYTCPLNFSFQIDSNRCGWAEKSETCHNAEIKQSENRANTFSCTYLEDGMYPDYDSNCRRYFVCENGDVIRVYCPERQKFNADKMMCDREEFVTCSSQNQEATAKNFRQNKQSDGVYHVYRPDDLVTETYSYMNQKSEAITRPPATKSKVWDDYDPEFEGDNISSSTDLNDDSNRSRAPNSIHVDITNKRPNPQKYTPPIQDTTILRSNGVTTLAYEDKPKHSTDANRGNEKVHIKTQNRDFDEACRKEDTGFFPDYESGCRMFHICFRSIRKTYSCPSVLLFNPETKNCDLPENVVCSRPEPLLPSIFDCKTKLNKFLPDYDSGCRYYIGCVDNLPYRFACPKGKIFNPEPSVCEYENSYKCEYPEVKNSTNYESNNDDDRRSPTYRHVHGIPGRFYFSCSDKKDGFYPDFTRHCHVFYRCVRGKKFSHYCKQGLLFNPESGICDFEDNVTCLPVNRTISLN